MGDTAAYLVIGLGNEFRGDDGCGPAVARRINQSRLPGVEIVQPLADGTGMVARWNGAEAAFLIDSVLSGSSPGRIFRFEPFLEPIPENVFRTTTTHRLGLTQIVQLARALGQLPKRLIAYGIEGASFDHGAKMTEEVAKAVEQVSSLVTAEIRELTMSLPVDEPSEAEEAGIRTSPIKRLEIRLTGRVQGVGFRPYVYRLADSLGLVGSVRNTGDGVTIDIQGAAAAVDRFIQDLPRQLPPHASIDKLTLEERKPVSREHFVIEDSLSEESPGATVLPDLATCPECMREITDPDNRLRTQVQYY
jgi:hydrogenase maturation protease